MLFYSFVQSRWLCIAALHSRLHLSYRLPHRTQVSASRAIRQHANQLERSDRLTAVIFNIICNVVLTNRLKTLLAMICNLITKKKHIISLLRKFQALLQTRTSNFKHLLEYESLILLT